MAECPIIFPDTVQVVWNWSLGGRTANIVTHARISSGQAVNTTLATAIFTALKNSLTGSGLAPVMSATTNFTGIQLRDLRDAGFPLVGSTGAALPGTGAGGLMPKSVAAVLTVRTARAGKRFRGRMYFPGFDEVANDPTGIMSAPTKTALDAVAAGLPGAYTTGGVTLAVFSRPVMDPLTCVVTRPGLLTDATQVLCRDTRWDSQRRRNN